MLKTLLIILSISVTFSALAENSLQTSMVNTGGEHLNKAFDSEDEVSKQLNVSFRKETKFKVEKGIFKAIPPKIAYAGNPPKKSKWGESNFSRVTFSNVPQDYVAKFRVKFNIPEDKKMKSKGKVYFDMAHRYIRVTFGTEGTKLVLSNHLLGKESEEKEPMDTMRENPVMFIGAP